ncbi:MAG: hypothetical protein K2M97_01625, partial [Muribaculaceae bacterium]|nr:hypothetical protein [Muribaculaceae bacterium]
MKKSALIAMACAALMSASAYAQQAPEITYVEDPAQGYTFNRFKDNWFLGIEGGVNYQFSKYDHNRKWSDRFAPQASIYFGKWFSPIIGSRVSLGYVGMKGLTNDAGGYGFVYKDKAPVMYKDKYYKTFVYNFGGSLDMMVNFTNWWCGYKPNRVYNFIAYAGGSTFLGFQQGEDKKYFAKGYDTTLALRVGFINSFNVSKQVALALDIRYMAAGANRDDVQEYNTINNNLGATLSLTYFFKNRTWTAPIVPVIPEIPTCDEYKAQLAEADAKINNLQKQLNDCLNRPVEKPAPCIAPLATVYFPIGSARLNRVD